MKRLDLVLALCLTLTSCAPIKRHPMVTATIVTGAFAATVGGTVYAVSRNSQIPTRCQETHQCPH